MLAKGEVSPLQIAQLNQLVDRAIFEDWHNVVIIWGELGKGKTTLMLRMLYRIVQAWDKVLSFVLEPHVCMKCQHEWDAGQPYVFELGCPKCGEESKTKELSEAVDAVYKGWHVSPFPWDLSSGLMRKFPQGQVFTVNSSKARGEIHQKYPYLNFSFEEVRHTIERSVDLRVKLPMMGWDDIAVYFHRSNIQYMHPKVKNFFSRYNFIRKYVANMVLTVPDPEFVPQQLALFCTADIMLQERGKADLDTLKKMRSFYGQSKTWTKHYDGRDVTWEKVPDEHFQAYEEIRHAHAVQAFEKPEEILVTTMPKTGREFTEAESLF